MSDIIVIGGGAAGLMAAFSALKNNNNVMLFEKNEKLGKKMFITGKGRCNVTNDISVDEFFDSVITNPKFLLSSLYGFTPDDTMSFFESRNTHLKTERGGRVFPLSDKSSDIIKCLEKQLISLGCKIFLNENVKELIIENNQVKGIKTDKSKYFADNVICATGGISYPLTGSTGDGYNFAKLAGHKIIDLRPGLVGLNIKESDILNLQGLSLKNINLSVKNTDNNKIIKSEFGEMLFTHFGISGPVVLSLSSFINRKNLNNLELVIDLKPALSEDTLDARIIRDFKQLNGKALKNSLDLLLPKKLIPIVLERSKINQFKKNNEITKAERSALIEILKKFKLHVTSLRPIKEAIITSGGVNVKEIDPKTMQSKIVKGLYFCGEVLDVDALTGGFNIQIAFSTGFAAGNSIY